MVPENFKHKRKDSIICWLFIFADGLFLWIWLCCSVWGRPVVNDNLFTVPLSWINVFNIWIQIDCLLPLSFISPLHLKATGGMHISHWFPLSPVNANANLLFGIMGKAGGRPGRRSGWCVQKEQSHYWGAKSFHTDLNCLVLASSRGDQPGEKHHEEKLSAPLWPDTIKWTYLWIVDIKVCCSCKDIIYFLQRSSCFHSIDLYQSAEQVTQIKFYEKVRGSGSV